MQVEPTRKTAIAPSLTKRFWIGPVWGLVASVLVLLLSRTAGFDFPREASAAAYMLVFVLVSTYRNGELKTRPARAVAYATGFATISVLIVRFFR